jgi:hypothetical protein
VASLLICVPKYLEDYSDCARFSLASPCCRRRCVERVSNALDALVTFSSSYFVLPVQHTYTLLYSVSSIALHIVL